MKQNREAVMQNTNIVNLLKSTPLFSDVDEKKLADTALSSAVCEYSKGDEITSDGFALYVVLHGSANVYRTEGGQRVLLNTIKENGVFGAAQLFCEDKAFSSVKASTACTCLKIPKAEVSRLLASDSAFSLNYVSFLSDRIRFLNKKIASFTAGSGEQTLASYLLSLPADDDTVKLGSNMSSLAKTLNLSRPTLYRALISLQNRGIIEKNGKDVKILSKQKLKSI